jgi:outer membrane protein TolC
MQTIKPILLCLLLLSGNLLAAQTMRLEEILDSIQIKHPAIKMYDYEIRSLDEASKGAKSWMAPEFSTGFFMTPYNPNMWKKREASTTGMPSTVNNGMGQYMIGGQQMLPNRKKQDADAAYMNAMSSVEKEKKNATLNELVHDAKSNYFDWIILQKKLLVLKQNQQLLGFMISNAQIRYKNGLDKISAYYKAKAAVGNLKNMQLMYESEIAEKRIRLNSLMGRNTQTIFKIDTSYQLSNFATVVFDSSLFFQQRSDLRAIDKDIQLSYLKQEQEKLALKPQFGVRYENMFGFGGLPMQFTLMGMLKLPLTNWSSKMNKANVESLKWKANALQSQKEMLANEYSGMASGMRNEWILKQKQMQLYEQEIIPALNNNYKSMQLAYEQNTEELYMLFDAWESLYMTQLQYLDLLAGIFKTQVSLERLMEKK